MSVNQPSCFHVDRTVSGVSRDSMMELQDSRPLLPAAGGAASYQFARVVTLSKYIPALSQEIPRDGMAKRSAMFKMQLAVAALVLVANVAGTAWAGAAYPPDRRGIGTFLTALHVLLNVLSTLLLGAGNYCMQLLASPSRSEADNAHACGVALDIGVPSIKNLRHIDGKRVVGWSAIGVTATLLHLFWNSTIFTSLPVAGDNWLETYPMSHHEGGTPFDLSPIYSMKTNAMNLTRLEPKDCVYESLDILRSTRLLLVVAKNMTSAQNNGSSPARRLDDMQCNKQWADSLGNEWVVRVGPRFSGIPNILVDYCLGRCGLHHSMHIMIVVCVCTAVEFMLILWTARHFRKGGKKRRERILVTMGDAISDFLEEPDRCGYSLSVVEWVECRVYWFKAASLRLWALLIALSSGRLGSYMVHLESFGVGMDLPRQEGGADLIRNILVANSPQVIFSFIYLFYNNILTRQLAADEWVRFVSPSGKKPLRVSAPAGMQRSSHFLSLPMRYGVPLMANSMLLHSLISQGIFLVQTSSFSPGPDGLRLPEFDVSATGFSVLGIILALVLCAVSVLVLIAHSFAREYRDIPPGFQLMGLSSAAIGLMCRRPEGDTDAHLFPVRMGVVYDQKTDVMGVEGRLVFSTDIDLRQPVAKA
ncbi:hypothetical protein B0H14DRAFT_2802673, partial [Mycena olivaceomarginata]